MTGDAHGEHREDQEFLPRPQKDQPAIAVGNRHPEVSLPAAFDAFGRILKSKGLNVASTVQLSATREMTTERRLASRTGENPTELGLCGIVDDAGSAGEATVLGGRADRIIHTGDPALVNEVDEQFEFIHCFKVGGLGREAVFQKDLESLLQEFGDSATKQNLLGEQVGFGFLGERRIVDTGAGAATADGFGV